MKSGSGYLGSSNLQTSTANMEIIPASPAGWTMGYSVYKLSFFNQQDMHCIINGETTLFLAANQGFSIDQNDRLITSFVIVEPSITFNWIGAF